MNSFLKKNIYLLLIISFILPSAFLSSPKQASATWPTIDPANLVKNIYNGTQTALTKVYTYISSNKETVLDPIAYTAARLLIRQLTQSIVDWINGGFNGNPSFIQDPGGFLTDSADRIIGEFIFGSDLAFLCKPFKVNIQLSLGLSFSYNPFKDRINCRLSDVLANTEGAYDSFMDGDFINGGGWDSWLSITTNPQNNQLGAMVIARAEMDARIDNDKAEANLEATWGSGTLSYKDCTETIVNNANGDVVSTKNFKGSKSTYPNNSTGEVTAVVECKTVTPGSLINDQMKEATGSDLKQLQLADEFNEIVGALANYMITSVISKGLLAANSTKDADNANWQANINALEAEQEANLNTAYGDATAGSSASDAALANNQNPVASTSPIKLNALNAVQNQINLEQAYQTNIANILTILYYGDPNTAYRAFANKTSCAPGIQSAVLYKIDGTTAYDPTDAGRLTASENLNVPALQILHAQANTNIVSFLPGIINMINSATSTNEADYIKMVNDNITLNSSMHTQADVDSLASGGTRYNKIRDWLITMQNAFKGAGDTCKANLDMWRIR